MTRVEIRPIPMKRWHGVEGKDTFTRSKKLGALVDPNTMKYATGLDYVNKNFKHPNTGEELTEAEYYSILLKQDLSDIFDPSKPHVFWDSPMGSIKLENNTQFLFLDKALDYIKYKIVKASRFVANSLKEYEEGLYPEATHILYDEKEEVEAKAAKIEINKKAVIECSKISKDKKIQLILILSGKNFKGKSDGFIEVELDKLISKDAEAVLLVLKNSKEDLALKALVMECLAKQILKQQGHKIMYFESILGTDVEDVVSYLKKEDNNDLKIRLISLIES